MPHTSDKCCICARCGKTFTIKAGDNIKYYELKDMIYCKKCKIIIFALNHIK